MKSFKLVIVFVLVWLAPGCSLFGYEKNEVKMMPVDTLIAPVEVTATEPFSVRVVGLLTNGCQRFERLEVKRTRGLLELRMFAREQVRYNAVCTDDIRLVEQDHTVAPPLENPFEIVVHQRDGSTLRKSVGVK